LYFYLAARVNLCHRISASFLTFCRKTTSENYTIKCKINSSLLLLFLLEVVRNCYCCYVFAGNLYKQLRCHWANRKPSASPVEASIQSSVFNLLPTVFNLLPYACQLPSTIVEPCQTASQYLCCPYPQVVNPTDNQTLHPALRPTLAQKRKQLSFE